MASNKLTVDRMVKEFEFNFWGETIVKCPDGAMATVTPCGYGEINGIEDCDYFLVSWDIPWGGQDTIERLVAELNKHKELKEELDKDREQIRQYFNDHEKSGWDSDSWSFYSDWHKDLYGYRPHGRVCGVYINPHRF